jgi:FAD/FMN-containing dehydrogenase
MAGVEADVATVRELCLAGGARNVRVAGNEAERLRLWQGRKKAFGAMGRLAPHLVVQDAVIPRTKLAEVLATITRIAAHYDVHVCNVFHAGDGNLHPNIPYNADDPGEAERVHLAMGEIMRACVDAGGSITGEHGVGLDKLNYIELIFSPDSLDAMCRLRSAFDPDRRSNPGKVVPVHSCQEWKSAPSATRQTAGASA